MRILITGGAGFIGSQIAAAYLQDGHEVAVLDNFSTGLRKNVPAAVQLFIGDITCQSDLENAFRQFAPEVVSHHAAQIDVRHSLADPSYAVSVNVLGGLNVLRQATRYGAKRFIFASSGGAIYGEARRLPARESTRAQPISPYGLTKAGFEACLRVWAQVHGIVPVVLRYANVYGPRQRADGAAGVIANFAHNLLIGKPCVIYGDGSSTRDYVYVADVVQANRLALGQRTGGVFNIGTGRETCIRELYDKVRSAVDELVGRGPEFSSLPQYALARTAEVYRNALHNGAAREKLGWAPQTSLRQGIIHTVAWLSRRNGQSVGDEGTGALWRRPFRQGSNLDVRCSCLAI